MPVGAKQVLRHRLSRQVRRFSALGKSATSRDPLDGVPKSRRAAYEDMIGLIYECSGNMAAALALVERLTARLRGLHNTKE
jgi:hypothetical protein